ncbi:MAG: sialate O-acetylesterase [Lachnospiraceae bacterium]|nr:sialate O-acetylesterase [Lachnospiraceae bacterium]
MRERKIMTLILCLSMAFLISCAKNEEPAAIEIPSSTENDITGEKLSKLDNETQDETIIVIDEPDESDEAKEDKEEDPVIQYSETKASEVAAVSENEIPAVEEEKVLKTEDGKVIVDLVMFMGQSNMSGVGGNVSYAPKVSEGVGYEFRAISDPTRLYPIEEPFGKNENNINGIYDLPGSKNGSMVSAFANKYYEETKVPIVAVSASQGGTDTQFWMLPKTTEDFRERQKRAQVWLESNNYYIRKQYVIWLQGESDALGDLSSEAYKQNMDNIIRPLFIGGVQKVFIVTPGRIIEEKDYFKDIVSAQLDLCRNSGYYALATTVLNAVSTEYMIDSWHYNQTVLNLVGEMAAESAAYYTNNQKEMCLYDYENNTTYIPDGFDYPSDVVVEPVDVNNDCGLERY